MSNYKQQVIMPLLPDICFWAVPLSCPSISLDRSCYHDIFLNNFDKTYREIREYSLAPIDDLIRFWRSQLQQGVEVVKVTTWTLGCQSPPSSFMIKNYDFTLFKWIVGPFFYSERFVDSLPICHLGNVSTHCHKKSTCQGVHSSTGLLIDSKVNSQIVTMEIWWLLDMLHKF